MVERSLSLRWVVGVDFPGFDRVQTLGAQSRQGEILAPEMTALGQGNLDVAFRPRDDIGPRLIMQGEISRGDRVFRDSARGYVALDSPGASRLIEYA